MQLFSLPLNPNCSWTGTGGSAGLAVAVSLLVPGILRASKRLDFGLLKLRTVSSLWCFVSSEESLGLFPPSFKFFSVLSPLLTGLSPFFSSCS